MISPSNRLALLMHDHVDSPFGKMGFGLLRYGPAPTVVVIDRSKAGQNLSDLTGIPARAPIVASVREALAYGPDTLVPALAPAGGALPDDWMADIREALAAGLNLVNGLHRPLAEDPNLARLLAKGRWIWDIRREPEGLGNGYGLARETKAKRVLTVGTDMACGKMTAAIELDSAARAAGLRSKFLASGQIGIAIAGEGVPLDSVRVDFATGAVEQLVLKYGNDHDALFVEGQGSLLHPASTATLALLRGAMPNYLILVHRAGQETVARCPWVRIPPLKEVVRLYETVADAGGAFPRARVAGIALNTARLSAAESHEAILRTESETGLTTADPVRGGAKSLLDPILKELSP